MNDGAEHKFSTSSFRRLNAKEWAVTFDTHHHPQGVWSILIGANDNFGNITERTLLEGEYLDRTAPEISISVGGNEAGSKVASLDQFLITVSDNYDQSPQIVSVRLGKR